MNVSALGFLAALLLFALPATAFDFETGVEISGETVRVYASSEPFDPATAGIDTSKPWTVDGMRPVGGFPGVPTFRLTRLVVRWGEREYVAPNSLVVDLFDPHLSPRAGVWDPADGVLLKPAHDSKSLLIEMTAFASACCGYRVVWIVRDSGEFSRYVNDEVP